MSPPTTPVLTTSTPAPATPTPTPTVTPTPSPSPAVSLVVPDHRVRTTHHAGILGGGGSASTAGAARRLTAALAPGTAGLGLRTAAATLPTVAAGATRAAASGHRTTGHHNGHGFLPLLTSPAATVIQFVNVIPLGVWIALAAALALAAVGGAVALRSSRRARQREGEVAAVTAEALTDPLTGVLNRRGFSQAAERELGRARRYEHPLAVAFVDVRGLKTVNDSEGHIAGDRVLKQVSVLLRDSARTHDVVGRIGGDELAVLLVEQSAEGASAMTHRVRAQIANHRAVLGLSTPWDLTIGTASFPSDGDTVEDLLQTADRRLYEQRGIELGTGNGASRPPGRS